MENNILYSYEACPTMLKYLGDEQRTGGYSDPTAAGDSGQQPVPLPVGQTHRDIASYIEPVRTRDEVDQNRQRSKVGEGFGTDTNTDPTAKERRIE